MLSREAMSEPKKALGLKENFDRMKERNNDLIATAKKMTEVYGCGKVTEQYCSISTP